MIRVYEVLTLYREVFVTMTRNGIGMEDIMYLDMFNTYREMLAEGIKKADIWTFLSQEYKLPESEIKKAVKRLNQDYVLYK